LSEAAKTVCGSIRCYWNRSSKVPEFSDCSICSILQKNYCKREKSYIFNI
jgi:hypothetical protein